MRSYVPRSEEVYFAEMEEGLRLADRALRWARVALVVNLAAAAFNIANAIGVF